MNFYNKKVLYAVGGLFFVWMVISTFWYTCEVKGFCQQEKTNRTERIGDIDDIQQPIKKVTKTVVECDTYLKENLNREEIKKLQNFLNKFEGESLIVDGIYGNDTKKAVIDFQNRNQDKLTVTNGLIDEDTRYEINQDYCLYEFNKIKK